MFLHIIILRYVFSIILEQFFYKNYCFELLTLRIIANILRLFIVLLTIRKYYFMSKDHYVYIILITDIIICTEVKITSFYMRSLYKNINFNELILKPIKTRFSPQKEITLFSRHTSLPTLPLKHNHLNLTESQSPDCIQTLFFEENRYQESI